MLTTPRLNLVSRISDLSITLISRRSGSLLLLLLSYMRFPACVSPGEGASQRRRWFHSDQMRLRTMLLQVTIVHDLMSVQPCWTRPVRWISVASITTLEPKRIDSFQCYSLRRLRSQMRCWFRMEALDADCSIPVKHSTFPTIVSVHRKARY